VSGGNLNGIPIRDDLVADSRLAGDDEALFALLRLYGQAASTSYTLAEACEAVPTQQAVIERLIVSGFLVRRSDEKIGVVIGQ
jgi:hypothetical protein